jgi:hypothetical protein
VVLRILRGEDDDPTVNNTCVVLIPKIADPNELGILRHIGLCNVLYKIASKVVANKLLLRYFFQILSRRTSQLLSLNE